jgi:hypothetical protein
MSEDTPFEAVPAPALEAAPVVQDPAPVATPTPTIVIPDAVAHLVGEGKKYATVELALASVGPAQDHLTKIESENAELRAANEKARSQEDLLADWNKQISAQQTSTPQPVATPAPTSEAIGDIVAQQLAKQESDKLALANTKSVVASMTEHYGDAEKAKEAYISQAAALGLGVAGLNSLSAQSPAAVLKMLGLEKQSRPDPSPSRGGMNTEALNHQAPAPATPKSVMAGATSKSLQTAWDACRPSEG